MSPTEKHLSEFGAWLRKHREALGLSQEAAGKAAKMSRTQWTRLERGESGTKRSNIPSLAKAVKADLHKTYLLAGFDPPRSSVPAFQRNKFDSLFSRINQLTPEQARHVQSLLETVEREVERFILENRKKRIA